MQIRKAQRQSVNIKIAMTGPSGAGKTMSSLLLAKGIAPNGSILVIDTEDGSSNLYADHNLTKGVEFDVLQIQAPYTIAKYIKALEMGIDGKYDVIVIDSLSHAWAGEGGLLEKKSAIDSRGGNSYTNWATVTKEHESFKSKIVHCPTHVIVTMRSKQDYIMEANDKGKSAPKKVGLAPIQRDGMEYEFTTVFDIGMDHQFHVSKDRTGLFDGRIEAVTIKTGEQIKAWLDGGAPLQKPQAAMPSTEFNENEILEIEAKAHDLEWAYQDNNFSSANTTYSALSETSRHAVWKQMSPGFKEWFKLELTKQRQG